MDHVTCVAIGYHYRLPTLPSLFITCSQHRQWPHHAERYALLPLDTTKADPLADSPRIRAHMAHRLRQGPDVGSTSFQDCMGFAGETQADV